MASEEWQRLTRAAMAADGMASFWARPVGAFDGPAAAAAVARGEALPLLGHDGRAFALLELSARDPASEDGWMTLVATIAEARRWATVHGLAERCEAMLRRVSEPKAAWAGLDPATPRIMGIVNVTPDSFSDGGEHADPEAAIAHGIALLEAGADIIDVGGESTRPGAEPVEPAEEIRRVEPVVRALANRGALVSIDTRHSATMAASLAAGARIINDVSALASDPASLAMAARSEAAIVLMHMRGEPRTMRDDPHYDCAPLDILTFLEARIAACEAAGIARSRIAIDPGLGFGKRRHDNLQLLAHLSLLHLTGCPILLGASRKSFLPSRIDPGLEPKDRLPSSLVALHTALDQGVQLFRVHDVAETWQAIQVWRSLHDPD